MTLILHVIELNFLGVGKIEFEHLDNLQPTNNRISAGDCRDDIACHVLNLVERLLLDAEAFHSEIGHTGDKVDDIVVI